MMKLRYSLVLALAFGLLVSLAQPLFHQNQVQALSGSQFQAGRIIDDNVFFDGNAMDIPTVQAFLNTKVPSCDTNGTKPISSGSSQTRAQWAAANGKPAPPYTCLRDYTTPFYGMAADQYCSAIGYGVFSTAGILYSVGKACNISPKVLLILLQKEQSFVTDDWPWPIQYTKATGYGCPDSSLGTDVDANQNGCYDEFEGFFNQVYYAARQYQKYAKQPQDFNFQRNVNKNIQYNPNTGCGAGSVFIQNQATAGLYNYTPYQPNSAALSNLYGTGDGCSAYGNRNFWRMYNDWFGNTYGIPYSAEYIQQGAAPTVYPSQTPTYYVDYRNTGAQFWKDDLSAPSYYPHTRLAGSWPINRVSAFADSSWPAPNRPASVFTKVFENDGVTLSPDQHTVFPGQIARFQFKVKYPSSNVAPGTYTEHFEIVQEGIPNWSVPGGGGSFNVTVPQPFSAAFIRQSANPTVSPGQPSSSYSVDYKNTGAQFWKDDLSAPSYYSRTRLADSWPINRVSAFADSTWVSTNRPASIFTKVFESDGVTLSSDPHTVWPGQIARFQFIVKYPSAGIASGTYNEYFELVQEGVPNWGMPGGFGWYSVTVP